MENEIQKGPFIEIKFDLRDKYVGKEACDSLGVFPICCYCEESSPKELFTLTCRIKGGRFDFNDGEHGKDCPCFKTDRHQFMKMLTEFYEGVIGHIGKYTYYEDSNTAKSHEVTLIEEQKK